MRSSIKWLVRIAVMLIAVFSCGLIGLIWLSAVQSEFKILETIFTVSLMFVCAAFAWLLSKQVNSTLEALSETIQSIIDDSPKNTFSELDDTMLSKLQSQIIKLSGILKSNSLRQKEEKESIAAMISDISHQLKTPLANLSMYNALLLDNGLIDHKRAEFTQAMQSQIEKLNWLMESLIKMSRLETGLINLKTYKSPIVQTVLKAVSMVSLKAEQKNMNITFDGDESISLYHDAKWTQEAIFNILDNAVKYSPSNTVIAVSVTKYELFYRIDIADNGNGIKESDINKIFARFYRGENAKTSEGVGLGLFLSRKIIGEQGGYIKVKSILGKGSVISVFLPLDVLENAQ